MNTKARLISVVIACVVISRLWFWLTGPLGFGAENRILHLAVGLAFVVTGRVAVWLLIVTTRTGMSLGARCLWLVLALVDSAIALALFAVQETASGRAFEVRAPASPSVDRKGP